MLLKYSTFWKWSWVFIGAILISLAALASLHPARPLQAQPSSQAGNCEYEIAATADSAVTMGDMAGILTFVITNTSGSNCNGPIDYIQLDFDASIYELSNATSAPDGWRIDEIWNAGGGQAYVLYGANSTTEALSPGESRKFSVRVKGTTQGNNNGRFPNDTAQDEEDTLAELLIRYENFAPNTNDEETYAGNLPTWLRHGLAVQVIASPPSVAVGDSITVTMMVDNRSDTAQDDIYRTLTYTPTGLVTLTSGPTPITIGLTAAGIEGASKLVTHTFEALAEGAVQFFGSATNDAVSSRSAASRQVPIGDFTAQMEVTPEQIVAGQDVTVRMRVYNNGNSSLGPIETSPLNLVGETTALAASDPEPKKVASLPPGSTTTFEWTYTLTGTVDSTYAFTGTASIKNGQSTDIASSNTGRLTQYSAYVTPRRVGAGTPTSPDLPLVFNLANVGGVDLKKIIFTLPDNFNASGGIGSIEGDPSCTWTYDTGEFTGCTLVSGETAVLTLTFSSIPEPAVDSNYSFSLNLCSDTQKCLSGGQNQRPDENWEAAVDVPFTITRYRIEVAATPLTLAADGFSTSVITATVLEGAIDSPVPNAQVVFGSTGTQGTLSRYGGTTNANGVISVTFTAPVSFIDSQATILAEYLTSEGQVTLNLLGTDGPNPLYVGGTLDPVAGQPGNDLSLSLDTINLGSKPITLTAGTQISFTDNSGHTYSAALSSGTDLPTNTTRSLTFNSVLLPSDFTPGAYYPTLIFTGWITDPTVLHTYERPVNDPFSVGIAALEATLVAAPDYLNIGQPITVTMMVTNTGVNTANNINPTLLTIGGSGGAALATGPTPTSVTTLISGTTTAFTWHYTATNAGPVTWNGAAEALDSTTGINVSSSSATSNEVIITKPAALSAAFSTPTAVNVGQTFPITLTVMNNGDAAAQNLTAGTLDMSESGASYNSGPTPNAAPWLSGGNTTIFIWTYHADSTGTVSWTGTVTGTDVNDSRIVTATATSPNMLIEEPAALLCTLNAAPVSVGTGRLVTVTMTLTNTGEATARDATPAGLSLGGNGTANLVAGPTGAPSAISGGGTTQFTWIYQASAAGTVNWTGDATGTDGNDGTTVNAPSCTSNNITVTDAAFLISSITARPEAVGQNHTVTVTMHITNTGSNPATSITPSALALSNSALFSLVSGPAPASTDLTAGDNATFTWVYQSANNQTGTNTWTGNATGSDAGTPTNSLSTTSNPVTVYEVLINKSLQAPFYATAAPGEFVTYTITLENTSSGNAKLITITDRLPSGFAYGEKITDSCHFDSTPTSGETGLLTWTYAGNNNCSLNSGATATLSFTATVASTPNRYCNTAGYMLKNKPLIERSDLACVTVAWPEYEIISQIGSLTIIATVRIINGQPTILSWEIQP
ncbi:MAG: hypothetical protein U9Q70_05885 [Chloroflexota bacterium]|nr:hypothetical protein [Chloroflexota bacterium]